MLTHYELRCNGGLIHTSTNFEEIKELWNSIKEESDRYNDGKLGDLYEIHKKTIEILSSELM